MQAADVETFERHLAAIRNSLECATTGSQKTQEDDIKLIMLLCNCSRQSASIMLRDNKWDFFEVLHSRADITNKAEIYMQYRRTFRI